MVRETDLSWLAGIIDGEGSVTFSTHIRGNGNLIIVPFICITNTDKDIIENSKTIITKIGIDKINEIWRNNCKNPCCNLRVDKNFRVKKLVGAILPYLIGYKKNNAISILEFIKSREDGLLRRNTLGQIVRNGYTINEVLLATKNRTSPSATPVDRLLLCNNVMKE